MTFYQRDNQTIIDAETGELTYTRNMVMVPTPICVLFGFNSLTSTK